MRVAETELLDWIAVAVAVALAACGLSSSKAIAASSTSLVVALIFAFAGWALRGVDPRGAIAGAAVAFVFYRMGEWRIFAVLTAVFVITLVATKAARQRKNRNGAAVGGRTASQVLANLLVAAVVALASPPYAGVLMTAAFAELAADTVSSESGEAIGQATYLVSRWRKVPSGTNGGVSLAGTLLGIAAAYMIATIAFVLNIRGALWIAAVAGVAGMFVDSVLGAELENRGLLNNEAVNLAGTGSAVAIAWVLIRNYAS